MKLLAAILLIFSPLAAVWAQTTNGALTGIVSDGTGLPLPEVSITAVQTDTNRDRKTVTDRSGSYTITNLPVGIYRLEFKLSGFKTILQPGIEVTANSNKRYNQQMEVGPLSETVSVEAPSPLLQTDNSSIGSVIRSDLLQGLPTNGRQFENIVVTRPGAVTSAPNSHLSNRGGINFGGVDEHYQSSFVDGIDNVDPVIRISNYRPSIDAISEVKLEESGSNAEFGRNGGGVISVTTRSGTNALHWSFWEFLRNDNFDARNFFAPVGFAKPSLNRNQFGGTFGGPIKHDRTFFFVSYEGLRQKTGQTHRASVPTLQMRNGDLTQLGGPVLAPSQINPIALEAIQAYPVPNLPGVVGNRIEIANKIENSNDLSVRLDHRLTSKTQLMGRYSTSIAHVLDPFRTETSGISNLAEFGQTADRFRTNLGFTVITVLRPGLVNEFRAGFNRFRQPQIPLNPGTALQQPLMGFLKTFPIFDLGSTFERLGSNAEFKRAVNVYNYTDSLSWVKGSHQAKFGADIRRNLFNAYNVGPNIFAFTGFRSATSAGPGLPITDFLLGLPTQTVSFNGSPTANTQKFEFAAYGQDDWKVTPRLTINYGLRWEFYGRIKERVNKQSLWMPDCNCIRIAGVDASEGLVDNDFNNFAPRLGFAWRPIGDRTVIRASSGIYYDNDMRHNLELATNPPFFFTREFTFPPSLSDPFPAALSASTLRPTTLDKHYRDTYVEQWNLSVQRDLPGEILLEAAYVGNHSVNGRRVRNVNQAVNGVLPYPGFGPISLFEQAGSSHYNALQLRAERRLTTIFGFTTAYTWGHAIDDRPGQGGARPQNSYDMRAERADADFDVRHNWTSTFTAMLPWGASKFWGRWTMNVISTLQAGRPFTISMNGITPDRPNVVPGIDWVPANQGPDHWINPAAFSPAALGTFGTAGRNTLRGPQLHNFDVSLVKTERIGDAKMEFRAEFFNIFNHPNFGLPNAVMGSSLGLISTTSTPERQIQFGIKTRF